MASVERKENPNILSNTKETMGSLLGTMGAEKSCRSLIKRDTKVIPKSYFLNISISSKKSTTHNEPFTKVRIKIPKLLFKTVQKKEQPNIGSSGEKNSDKKKRVNPRNIVPNKIASLFSNASSSTKSETESNACGSKDSAIGSVPYPIVRSLSLNRDSTDSNFSTNAEECDGQRAENNTHISYKTDWKDSKSLRSSSMSSDHSSYSGDQPFILESISPVSEFHSSNENMEIEEKDINPVGINGTSVQQTCVPYKIPLRLPTSLKSFLYKGTNFKSAPIVRTPRRFLINLKARMAHYSGTKVTKKIETEDAEEGDKELCKKRILMGERCQPPRFSGCFQYDESDNLITALPPRSSMDRASTTAHDDTLRADRTSITAHDHGTIPARSSTDRESTTVHDSSEIIHGPRVHHCSR